MLRHELIGRIGQSLPIKGSGEDQAGVVQHQLSWHADSQQATFLHELPTLKTVALNQPTIDAEVVLQVGRCHGGAMLLQIVGRCHDCHMDRGADGNSHHVTGDIASQADAGIETILDDVHEAIVGRYLQRDVRVAFREFPQSR